MQTPKTSQGHPNTKGFGLMSVLLVVLVLAAVGGAGVYAYHRSHRAKPVGTTGQSSTSTYNATTTPKPTPTPVDPYTGWKTYSNTTYGISYKYPSTWMPSDEATYTASQIQQSATKQEFGGGLKLVGDVKYGNTVDVEVLDESLAVATAWYDNLYAQSASNNVTKTNGLLKGKDSVQYVVTNSGVESKRYLFAVGAKTYMFASLNEATNVKTASDYWATFDKVFGSLQIN